jgi:hypothetical protein
MSNTDNDEGAMTAEEEAIMTEHTEALKEHAEAIVTTAPPLGRLGVMSFGVACGITLAVAVFILAMATAMFGWGIGVVQVLSTLYIGYEPSFVGAVWAFVDGFIGGAVLAWIYNKLVSRRR